MDFLTIENDTVAIITQFSDTYLIYEDTTYLLSRTRRATLDFGLVLKYVLKFFIVPSF